MGRLLSRVPNENPDRVQRVLDAKYRTIGVDKSALDAQSAEKRERDENEKERDRQYAHLAQHFDEELCTQQIQAEVQRREFNIDHNTFRATQQGSSTTREWDLNRPDALKIDHPGRIGDDDARCGISSLQRFNGEDLLVGNREKAQMEQCMDWWKRQSEEHDTLKRLSKNEEMAYAEQVKQLERIQKDSALEEERRRRLNNKEIMEENMRMANERKQREAEEREKERFQNDQELDAILSSTLMTEDPRAAVSALGHNRVRTEYWKGMTDAEKKYISTTLFNQVEEVKERRQRCTQEESIEDRMMLDVNRELLERAAHVEAVRRERAEREAEYLRKQMEEKRERDRNLNQLYANKVADEYFTQFGTSHR